jgi:16S rRNA (uracil1498-N3)-methyltransferase
VLRLSTGDQVAVLPGDGRVIRCRLDGRTAAPLEVHLPETEPKRQVTLALALPKAGILDDVVRLCTEIGVAAFALFPSDRSVVRWEAAKLEPRLRRLAAIAREAAEVAFRTRLPAFAVHGSLAEVLAAHTEALVLSEGEDVAAHLSGRLPPSPAPVTLVIGPEGGWAPREVEQTGARAVTLGPRVLRVDTAAAAAVALAILGCP